MRLGWGNVILCPLPVTRLKSSSGAKMPPNSTKPSFSEQSVVHLDHLIGRVCCLLNN